MIVSISLIIHFKFYPIQVDSFIELCCGGFSSCFLCNFHCTHQTVVLCQLLNIGHMRLPKSSWLLSIGLKDKIGQYFIKIRKTSEVFPSCQSIIDLTVVQKR